jgi:MYXO-CTERM domain-containing protein
MYASTVTPNAYYIGFEDGGTYSDHWGNDGDFNDDVFFLTGITCSGGGQTCDTGQPGICGPGVTQCTASGVVCQQLSQPKGESCNGLDDDCNGQVDEGDLCPSGFICDKGACVQSCQGGEFNCPPSKVCTTDGHCVDPACKDVNCDPGKVCVGGTCNGPCDGVVCPFGQVCRVGECVDPCAGVTCDQGQVCDGGVCVARCDCLPCTAGKACDTVSGVCGDPACVGAPPCDPGKYCLGGTCVDACTGVTCPTGQACMAGQCVAVQGTGGTGGSTSVGFGVGVGGSNGTGGKAGAGGGTGSATGGSNAGGAFNATGGNGATGRCGCEVVGAESDSGALAWLALSALGLVAARRRK